MGKSAASRTAVVIEDDDDIRSLLEVVLSQAGFDVTAAATGADGVQCVRRVDPDVTILDIGLPDIDGFAVVRMIREFSPSLIVVLSARDDEFDVLHGLSAGADTYITKPFRPRELRARIEALIRRSGDRRPDDDVGGTAVESTAPAWGSPSTTAHAASPSRSIGSFAHNGLHVNVDIRRITVDGRQVTLTPSEFQLLTCLVSSGRRVLSKVDLALALRADDGGSSDYVSHADRRTVETHMGNLRRKLGDLANARRFIETVRGVGYRLADPQ